MTLNKTDGLNRKMVYILMSMIAMLSILSLAACGGDAATPTTAAPTQQAAATDQSLSTDSTTGGTATTMQATLREWAIDLSQSEVPAGTVTFTVNNTGTMGHNLTVLDGSGAIIGATPTFQPSDSPQTLEVTLQAGTYTLICSLPGHAQRGQRATLVVK